MWSAAVEAGCGRRQVEGNLPCGVAVGQPNCWATSVLSRRSAVSFAARGLQQRPLPGSRRGALDDAGCRTPSSPAREIVVRAVPARVRALPVADVVRSPAGSRRQGQVARSARASTSASVSPWSGSPGAGYRRRERGGHQPDQELTRACPLVPLRLSRRMSEPLLSPIAKIHALRPRLLPTPAPRFRPAACAP